MSKGLFFGLTTVDIFNTVPRHPGPNEKMRADWQAVSAGGPAANAAVAYAALGNESHLCTAVGSHPVGRLAISDLSDHGVRLHDHADDPEQLPVLSTILVNAKTAERAVVYGDVTATRGLVDIDYEQLLSGCSTVLVDGFYPEQGLPLLIMAQSLNITTVLDAGSWKDGMSDLLPCVDIAICSTDYQPPGCTTSGDVFSYLAAQGIGSAAISRGNQPILVFEEGAISSIDIMRVEAKDTLGAGDILHGAFCHYIVEKSFTQSLEHAARIASDACRTRGTRQWIKGL